MQSWPPKDPDEVLDYEIDWSNRLTGGDTIDTSTWIVEDGTVAVDTDSKTTTATVAWLSGGANGETCILTNRVVTVGGRTMDEAVKIKIKSKSGTV